MQLIFRLKLLVCSTISVILIAFVSRKIYRRIKIKAEKVTISNRLRTERRRNLPDNLSKDQLCVVCSTNPKEVISWVQILTKLSLLKIDLSSS